MKGTSLGIISGYAGGWIDEIITRIVDIWQALPFLPVALVLYNDFWPKHVITAGTYGPFGLAPVCKGYKKSNSDDKEPALC